MSRYSVSTHQFIKSTGVTDALTVDVVLPRPTLLKVIEMAMEQINEAECTLRLGLDPEQAWDFGGAAHVYRCTTRPPTNGGLMEVVKSPRNGALYHFTRDDGRTYCGRSVPHLWEVIDDDPTTLVNSWRSGWLVNYDCCSDCAHSAFERRTCSACSGHGARMEPR